MKTNIHPSFIVAIINAKIMSEVRLVSAPNEKRRLRLISVIIFFLLKDIIKVRSNYKPFSLADYIYVFRCDSSVLIHV